MSQDLYLNMLQNTSDKVDELKDDVNEIKSMLASSVSDLKISQAKCDSRWNIFDKVMGFLFSGISISALFSWWNNTHHK